MREIKFRAFDLTTDTMYHPGEDGTQVVFGMWQAFNDDANYTALWAEDGEIANGEDLLLLEYTGLKDKNGVEIYEDDILEVSVYEGQKEIIRIVFDDGCFCHIGYLSDLRTYPLRDFLFNGTKLKVVGNVHDNPELLEVAE